MYVMFLFVVSKFHVCCGEEGDASKVVLPTSMFELICRLICLAMKFRMLEGVMAVVNIEKVDNWYPKLGELVGDGINSMLSPGRALIAQRSSNGKVRNYVVVRVEEGWAKEFVEAHIHGGSERARELLLSFFDGWSRELVDFIRRYDDEPMWAKHSR